MKNVRNNILRIKFIVVILALLSFIFTSCVKKPQFAEGTFFAMGTLVQVTLPLESRGELKNITRLIDELSVQVSSATEEINSGGNRELDPFMCGLMKRGEEYRKISGGRFNTAVYTLLELYGFPDGRHVSHEDKAHALKIIEKGVTVFEENGRCYANANGGKIDLGAFAKGAIVDEVVRYLHSVGVRDFIVNAGGDLYASGSKNGAKWRLGIRNPQDKNSVAQVVELSDKALATSGTYERYFIGENGEKISHLVNALTGEQGDLYVSLSVEAETTEKADALATVYFFMTEGEIKSRCRQDNVKVWAISDDNVVKALCK
ncbi:MAG: FAD:protein FMN transferase [Deferribacterales bacterium]|nr:FAD:protein FMN transferase [Deferribacterales bacterium]